MIWDSDARLIKFLCMCVQVLGSGDGTQTERGQDTVLADHLQVFLVQTYFTGNSYSISSELMSMQCTVLMRDCTDC